jgi:predicted nucleotidyltransferase
MRPSIALKNHKTQIISLAEQFGVRNIRVFGSVLHGVDREGSDLDLLVDVPQGTNLLEVIGLQQQAEDLLGVKVEVLTADDLPGSFREEVLREARPL